MDGLPARWRPMFAAAAEPKAEAPAHSPACLTASLLPPQHAPVPASPSRDTSHDLQPWRGLCSSLGSWRWPWPPQVSASWPWSQRRGGQLLPALLQSAGRRQWPLGRVKAPFKTDSGGSVRRHNDLASPALGSDANEHGRRRRRNPPAHRQQLPTLLPTLPPALTPARPRAEAGGDDPRGGRGGPRGGHGPRGARPRPGRRGTAAGACAATLPPRPSAATLLTVAPPFAPLGRAPCCSPGRPCWWLAS